MKLREDCLIFTKSEASGILWHHEDKPCYDIVLNEIKQDFLDDLAESFMETPRESQEVIVPNVPPSRDMIARRIIRIANLGSSPTEPRPPKKAS